MAASVDTAYVEMFAEFKSMGLADAARSVLQDGLASCPTSGLLMELGLKEDLLEPEVAESVGAAYAKGYVELSGMDLDSAANQILREGLTACPSSPLLHLLASRLMREETPAGVLWRADIVRQPGELGERHRKEVRERRKKEPPCLPERHSKPPAKKAAPFFVDKAEYPDPRKGPLAAKVTAGALVCGFILARIELCPATWLAWSFLAVHAAGALCKHDCTRENSILAICAVFGLHAGHASSECVRWLCNRDGGDSLGSWSLVVISASALYVSNLWAECSVLPPDYITSRSFFFTTFPVFNVAVVVSCLEFFLEWRYLPDHKLWFPAVALGTVLMLVGHALIWWAWRVAGRNYWAYCRDVPEDDPDGVGLEIPDRCIVEEGPYRWERHPAYLGALLLGVGAELTLCNPVMLLLVGFVLWAVLLHVVMEEEKELQEEFKQGYLNYMATTTCWIPLVNSVLYQLAFQRSREDSDDESEIEGADAEEENEPENEEEEEEEEENTGQDDPGLWVGVPKGGALWNRQFRDAWRLG